MRDSPVAVLSTGYPFVERLRAAVCSTVRGVALAASLRPALPELRDAISRIEYRLPIRVSGVGTILVP
jgi:hypothetical protein